MCIFNASCIVNTPCNTARVHNDRCYYLRRCLWDTRRDRDTRQEQTLSGPEIFKYLRPKRLVETNEPVAGVRRGGGDRRDWKRHSNRRFRDVTPRPRSGSRTFKSIHYSWNGAGIRFRETIHVRRCRELPSRLRDVFDKRSLQTKQRTSCIDRRNPCSFHALFPRRNIPPVA